MERRDYRALSVHLAEDRCPACGTAVAELWRRPVGVAREVRPAA